MTHGSRHHGETGDTYDDQQCGSTTDITRSGAPVERRPGQT